MKVITAVVNNPRFIELQHLTLKRYMGCSYEFVVFNDAKGFPDFTNGGDASMPEQIAAVCDRLGVRCIRVPNEGHRVNKSAMMRCADAYNYLTRYLVEYPDQYLCIDSDMFLIREFNPLVAYTDKSSAVVLQMRDNNTFPSIWNGLFYFDTSRMMNLHQLDWTPMKRSDVGGAMEGWLRAEADNTFPLPEDLRWKNVNGDTARVHFIRHLWSSSWDMTEMPTDLRSRSHLCQWLQEDPRNVGGKFFAEIYDGCILHYRAGGNWRGEGLDAHRRLTDRLFAAIVGDF